MGNLRKNYEKMRSLVLVSATVSLVLTGAGCQQQTATPNQMPVESSDATAANARLAEAETLWDGREDLSKARAAVATLRQAQTADYSNYEVAWKLSRAAFYVGEHTGSDSEQDDMFRTGIEAGKAAIQLQPNKPEGHFWLGANYGSRAAHSTLANLSSFTDIKNEMDAVMKIDESYEAYSAYLGLGRLYLQAPRAFGGDSKTAIEYLEKGVKLSPNNTMMRLDLAEAYAQNSRNPDAKKQIDAIMSATPDPKHDPERKEAMAKAQKLLAKINS
jgi:tetratricopeptide (TPR) repeat protein